MGMTEENAAQALRDYAKECKAYTDKQQSERRKKATVNFTGNASPSLRLESIVENRRWRQRKINVTKKKHIQCKVNMRKPLSFKRDVFKCSRYGP